MESCQYFFRSGLFAALLCIFVMCPAGAWAAIPGDFDGSGEVDLQDVIVAIQTSAGMNPDDVDPEADVNNDDRIGLEEAIAALQTVASFPWYKDADGDGYSDGIEMISFRRPSEIYYESAELIAISGDRDDNDAGVHPDTVGRWIPFDDESPADASANAVSVDVPVSTMEEVVVEYGIPGMNIAEVPEDGDIYTVINISDCGYTSEIGKPRLPAVRRYVAVPEGSVIRAEITDSGYRDLDGYSVYPLQEPMPDIEAATEPSFEMDTDLYQTDAFYPSEIVRTEGPVVIRGVSTVILEVCPVQFNPVKQMARVYSYMKVKLSFEGGKRSYVRKRLRSLSYDRILKRLLLNPQNAFSEKETRAAYNNGDSLLIVTHPNFLDAANTLKTWKIRKGIHTQVRTTGETGNTASAIQAYIKNAYNTWNPPPTYLLLLGDAEFVPTHYKTWHPFNGTACQQYGLPYDCSGYIGTDLYYATVDGDDYFPDICIGRLSVDTSAQADKRVNDIIGYEKNPVTEYSFYQKAAICAYFQHNGGGYAERRFAQTSEDLAIFLSDPGYLGKYSVDRIYYTESNIYPKSWTTEYFGGGPAGNTGNPIPAYLEKPGFAWDGDSTDIEDAINSGRFLVTHRDHGASWGWGDPRYTTGHVLRLTNGDRLPVVWSVNCQTGWFDNETDADSTETDSDAVHFSEAWERNPNGGAVGVIAATRVSYSGHNDRLVWGWTDALWPEFESSYSGKEAPVWEMGQVLNYGKLYYATKYTGSYREAEFEMFHWFGDPTMEIWTDVPKTLDVSHNSTLAEGADSIDVTVDQADALICVSKNGEILARRLSVFGENGLSWSDPLGQGDMIHITVSKHNCRPYEGTAMLTAPVTTTSVPTTSSSSTTTSVLTTSSSTTTTSVFATTSSTTTTTIADDTFNNSLGMTFNLIPAGSFTMGSPISELGRESDENQHQVTLTQAFYMQTTEVTQGQWQAVMGSNPSDFSSCGDDCPVETVSYDDIQGFITKMNQRGEGTYRLPTEAEWEYAARAGSTTAFANGRITEFGCGHDLNLNAMGWYCGNSDSRTHAVAQKQPNAYGLFDLSGNIREWCQDWYGDYPAVAVADPAGPISGSNRVLRGGSWNNLAEYCRSAYRYWETPDYRYWDSGFRLVSSPDQ